MKTIKIRYWEEIPNNFTGIAKYPNGTKLWFLNGKHHRIDGPAVEYHDGTKFYWIHGERIKDETAYWLLANIMKLKGLI